MKSEDKTKEQLVAQLAELQRENDRLRREVGDFVKSEIDYMRGARIGEILIELGCLTLSQLHRTLKKQKESDIFRHKQLGEIMIEQGLITIEERDGALVEQQRRLRRWA